MKTFEWRWVSKAGRNEPYIALLETNGGTAKFWSAFREKQGLYEVVVLDSLRLNYFTINESLSLKDAKEAVEKRLFDIGVIDEGDEITDYTEG